MRRIGDRKDGKRIRDLDPMHFIVPNLYPNRCDNEAHISETINLTNAKLYLKKKNAGLPPEERYSLFMLIIAAILKTLMLRPKMNRFIANKNFYQRNYISAAFVVKTELDDDSDEALARIEASPEDNIDTIRDKYLKTVEECRSPVPDASTKAMSIVTKLPSFISKAFVAWMCELDRHGLVPNSMIASDPYYSSVVLTNLGSIRLHAGYHHLTNWGTNSIFLVVGEKKYRPFFRSCGVFDMKDSIDIGMTVDERIADGYYFARSVRLLHVLLENPELLELPLSEPVKY